MDKAYVGGAPVGDFVVHHLMIHIPANEKAGEECTDRQAAIGREPVEEIKERHSEERTPVPHTQGKGTDATRDDGIERNKTGCIAAAQMQLLTQKRGAYFVDGYITGQGGNGQQQVEQDAHHILHEGHAAESLLKDIGQRDEDERRTAVRLNAHRKSSWEDDESGQNGYQRINGSYLKC